MKNRLAGILFGIILIILGVLFYVKDLLSINMSTFMFLLLGVVFIILYISQNRKLSLIFGVYFVYFGIAGLLGSELMENILPFGLNLKNFITGGFFCCPGVIFDVIYIRERKPDQLIVGALFTLAGIALMLGAQFFDAFLTGIGACLIADAFRGGRRDSLQAMIGLFILLFGLRGIVNLAGYENAVVSVVLICCGGALIVKSILREKN